MSDWWARLQQRPASTAAPSAVAAHEDGPGDDPVGQVVAAGHVGVGEDEHVLGAGCARRSAAAAARAANPPPPVWMGMPSALATSVPSGAVTKQEKSWHWLKIVLRAVRVITQPMCRLIWSRRFCMRARTTGSRWLAIAPADGGGVAAAGRGQLDEEAVAGSTTSSSPGPASTVVVSSSTSSGPGQPVAGLRARRRRRPAVSSQPCSPCHTLRVSTGSGLGAGRRRGRPGPARRWRPAPATRSDATMIVPPGCTWP